MKISSFCGIRPGFLKKIALACACAASVAPAMVHAQLFSTYHRLARSAVNRLSPRLHPEPRTSNTKILQWTSL